jgi:transposase
MSKKRSFSHSSVEIKIEAVRQVLENNRPVVEVANGLNLHRAAVTNWVNTYKSQGGQGLENPHSLLTSPPIDSVKQIRELSKKLKEKEMENEILKKFQAFLKGNE